MPTNVIHSQTFELDKYGVSFGDKIILDNITATLSPNGISVLMGPVASGKSTLLISLAGINDTNQRYKQWGTAQINGIPIHADNRPTLVRQHANVLDELVQNFLMRHAPTLIAPMDRHDFLTGIIKRYDLFELNNLKQARLIDLDPVWQRIFLILSVEMRCTQPIMIDEPTYGLKTGDANLMIHFLKTIGKQKKIIVTLHNQQQAKQIANDIVLIGGGKSLYSGSTQDFFNHNQNPFVQQFIKTGGLDLPSPSAKNEEITSTAQSSRSDLTPSKFVIDPFIDTLFSSNKHAQITQETTKPEAKTVVGLLPSSNYGQQLVSETAHPTTQPSRAPRGFFWIVRGVLGACPQPGVSDPISYDLDLLANLGITTLITLTEQDFDQYELQQAGLTNIHLPIYDREPPSLPQMHMLVHKMQRAINSGQILAVHCLAGLGRTGTIVVAWMMKEGGLSSQEALKRARLINPNFVQSESQEQALLEFENDILRRIS